MKATDLMVKITRFVGSIRQPLETGDLEGAGLG